jgi:hypothetical protein
MDETGIIEESSDNPPNNLIFDQKAAPSPLSKGRYLLASKTRHSLAQPNGLGIGTDNSSGLKGRDNLPLSRPQMLWSWPNELGSVFVRDEMFAGFRCTWMTLIAPRWGAGLFCAVTQPVGLG